MLVSFALNDPLSLFLPPLESPFLGSLIILVSFFQVDHLSVFGGWGCPQSQFGHYSLKGLCQVLNCDDEINDRLMYFF